MSGKDFVKSHVLSWRRKVCSDWEDVTSSGRSLHGTYMFRKGGEGIWGANNEFGLGQLPSRPPWLCMHGIWRLHDTCRSSLLYLLHCTCLQSIFWTFSLLSAAVRVFYSALFVLLCSIVNENEIANENDSK